MLPNTFTEIFPLSRLCTLCQERLRDILITHSLSITHRNNPEKDFHWNLDLLSRSQESLFFLSWWKCGLHYKAVVLCVSASTAHQDFCVSKASVYYVRRFLEKLMCGSVLCQSLIHGLKPLCQWQKIPFVPFSTASLEKARAVAAQQGHHANGSWLIVGGRGLSVIPLKSCFFCVF